MQELQGLIAMVAEKPPRALAASRRAAAVPVVVVNLERLVRSVADCAATLDGDQVVNLNGRQAVAGASGWCP
jgi:hypothetical protein